MINLNDYTQEEKEVKIFNGGNAGRVRGVDVSVIKKTPEDKDNAPDFKVLYTDSTGASVNDAVYYPKDSDTDSQKRINMGRIVSLLHALNPDTKSKPLPEFENYEAAVNFLIKQIIASSKNSKVNVFVAYGTENNPQQYLRVRKFNFVEPVDADDNSTRLRPKISPDPMNSGWNDVMQRITPTSFDDTSDDVNTEDDDDDLGW